MNDAERQTRPRRARRVERPDVVLPRAQIPYGAALSPARSRRRRYVINAPVLWGTLVSAAVIVGGGYFWHTFQSQRNALTLLKQADEQERAQQWTEAVHSLKQLARFDPENAAVRVRLARAFDHLADTTAARRQALNLYAVAAGAATGDKDVGARHLELLLEVGDPDGALARAEELLQLSPADPGALRARAIAVHERYRIKSERSAERVRDALVAANRVDPGDVAVATRLARFYRRELTEPDEADRCQAADAVMDALVESNVIKVDALIERHLYRNEFGLAGASDDLKGAVAADTQQTNAAVALAAGKMAMRDEQWDVAQDYIERAVGLRPERAEGYVVLGQIRQAQGDVAGALGAWQRGLEAVGGDDLNLQSQIAGAQIKLGRVADARGTLSRMEKQIAWLFGPEQTAWLSIAYALRADIALAQKQHAAAIPLLKRILSLRRGDAVSEIKAASDARVQAQIAECYCELRLWDQAATAYQSAAELQPGHAGLRFAAGHNWEQAGWLEEAARQFEQAVTIAPDELRAWQALADVSLRQQLLLPGEKRDWRRFHEALASARAIRPDDPFTQLLTAEGLLADGHPDQAAGMFEAAESAARETLELGGRLTFDYQRLGDPAKADALVAKLAEVLGNVPRLALVRAKLLVHRMQPAQAVSVLSEARSRAAEEQRGDLRYQIALLQVADGELGQARSELTRMAAENPADPRPLQLLIELDLQSGKLADARASINRLEALERSREDSGWRYYLAQELIAEASPITDADARKPLLDRARELASELEAMRPRWAPTYLLKARLAQLAPPNDDKAIQAYAQALRLGERRTAVYQELVSLLFKRNRLAEAVIYLEYLHESQNIPPALMSLAVAVDVWEGNLPRAIKTARSDVANRPQDSLAHLRLGQLLTLPSPDAGKQSERLAEAEAELKQARDLSPDDPRGWSALLAFYRRAGRKEQAHDLLTEVERRPALLDADRPFFLAQGYALLGDHDTAAAHYRSAAETASDRPVVLIRAAQFFWRLEPERAERYLRLAIDAEPQQTTAKRLLAVFLAERGDVRRDSEETWQLIEHDAPGGNWDVADRRFKAVLHLQQGGGESREQARQMLETIVGEVSQATSTDHLLLARVYEAQNQFDKARDQLETLVNRERPEPGYLAIYADYLLRTRRGDAEALGRVARLLDQLAKLEPETTHFRTLALRARWLQQSNRIADVRALGEKLVAGLTKKASGEATAGTGAETKPVETWTRLAALYASLGLDTDAEACYRHAAELEPTRYPQWVVWIAGHGSPERAVELCLKWSATDPSARPAITLAAALTAAGSSPRNRKQAEELIEKALKQYPLDRELLFTAAAMRSMSGDDKSATELLRQCLKLAPHDVAALNNLAMLLCETPSGGEEALSCIDRAIDQNGNHAELLDTKGWVLLRQHHPDRAEPILADALFREPGNPKYRFHLALCLKAEGKSSAAEEVLAQARREGLAASILCPVERSELNRLAQRTP